jgi:phosphate transport system protein
MKKEHTDRNYRHQLNDLKQRLLRMAGRVEDMIANSVKSLVERDLDLAHNTIKADNAVNRDEIEIDQLCLIILAKWQPMASDLRFLTLSLKMVTDLERIGDLAVNICERTIKLGPEPLSKPFVHIPKIAWIVQTMIREAVDAFVDADADKAKQVIDRDDEVDNLYHNVFIDLLGLIRQNENFVERGMLIQSVAKLLERTADHCTNLAEQVIFMVRGEDVRHLGKRGKKKRV